MKASSRAVRIAAQGAVTTRILEDGRGLILELNCETDFVARNTNFLELLEDIANQIESLSSKNKTISLEEVQNLLQFQIDQFSNQTGEKISLRRFDFLIPKEGSFISAYTHANNQFAVLVSVKGERLKSQHGRAVAMHIGALKPRFARRDEIPKKELEKLMVELTKSPALLGKTEVVRERILSGLLTKQLAEFVAEDQAFAMEPSLTVSKYLGNNNLTLENFIRYEVAEGIERDETDFVSEVKAQIKA